MNPNAQEWDPANPYTASSNNPSRGNPNANMVNTSSSSSYYPQQQQQQNYQEQYMRQLQEQQYAQQQYAQQLAQQREYYYREEQRRQQQQQQQQYQRQQYQQPQPQQQQQPRQQYQQQQPQQQQQGGGGSYYTYNNNNQSQSSNWNASSSSSSQSRPQQGGGRGGGRGRGGYQNEYRNNEYDRNNNAPYGGGRNRDQDRDNVGVYQQQQQQKQPYQERQYQQQYHQQHYQQPQQQQQQQQYNNKNNLSQNQSNNNNTRPVSKNYDTNTDDNFGSNTERNSGEAFDSMDAAEVVKTNSQPKAPQDFDDNSDVEDANADKNKKKRKRGNKKKKKTDQQPQEQQQQQPQQQPPSTNKNVKAQDTKPKEVKPVAGTEEKNITQSKTGKETQEKKTTEKSAPTTTTTTNKDENVKVTADTTKNETKEKTEPVARVTDKTASASTTQKPQPEEQPRAKEQAQESKKEKEKEKEDSPKKVVKDTNIDKSKIQEKEETKTETVGEGEEANEPMTAKQAREAKKSSKKVFKKKLNFDPHDPREHITLVAIGHVDAGKSTTSGQILLSTGQIDQRLIEKYQKEAKERGRDGWWVAYITDQDEEEKARGKTVDCARVQFETKDKRFTLLDAPGHNNYVPNMISGTALADVAILVVSARSGEFEAGFKRGGQTREHSLLTLTLGVPRVIVAINKMDFCEWKQERYETVKKEIATFLKEIGFKEKALDFLPIASLSGANFKTPLTPDVCPWYKGECLLDLLNNMKKIKRYPDDPLCIPVLARYKGDNGLTVIAKVETGIVSVGDTVLVMPCNQTATVTSLFIDEVAVQAAASGENILLCLDARSKVTLDNLIEGSVICTVDNPCPISRTFRAEAFLMELPTDSVLTVGYSAMLHIHNIAVECEIIAMPHKLHPKTRKRSKVPPKMLRVKESAIMDIQVKSDPIPLETFEKLPKLGRFALRDQGLTTVIGRVLEILPNK